MNHTHDEKPPYRVQAVGAYGFANFGDDLFVDTVRQHAASLWPGASVQTFAPLRHVRLYSSPGLVGKIVRLSTAAAGWAWADTVALCGGSILQDVSGVAKLRQRLLYRRRVEALGVSVGPFYSEAAAGRVGKFLKYVDRLVVRDQASVARLSELPWKEMPPSAVVGGDLVALNNRVRSIPVDRDRIVVCPSAAAGTAPAELAGRVRSALTEMPGANQVVVLALSSHAVSDDRPVATAIVEELHSVGVNAEMDSYERLGLTETCELLAGSAMVWSQRLHGGIVAYLSEVPFLLVGHHAKCIDFGADIGMSERIVSADAPWEPAVAALMAGSCGAGISASDYRRRAREAYFADPDVADPARHD